MKYAILFIPSGEYLYTQVGKSFPNSALFSQEETKNWIEGYECLFFTSKKAALQVFKKSSWEEYFGPDFIKHEGQKYYLTEDSQCFEIIKIEENKDANI